VSDKLVGTAPRTESPKSQKGKIVGTLFKVGEDERSSKKENRSKGVRVDRKEFVHGGA